MDYTYYVNVSYSSYMQTQIQALGLTSGTLLNIGTDSSTSPMTVDLTFDNVLSSPDVATLNTYMAGYADPYVTSAAIAAILSALASDTNLLAVLRAKTEATIPTLDAIALTTVCTLLGINPHL